MPDFFALLLGFAVLSIPVSGILFLVKHTQQKKLKRIQLLSVNLQLGLDYVRNLKQSNQEGDYPKLYRSLNQDAQELDSLIERYGNKLAPKQYQEAMQMIHIVSALQPKSNFLSDVTDGVLNLVEEIFPEAGRVTTKLRPKENAVQTEHIYDAADSKKSQTLAKMRYIQEVAPEVLELYSSLSKSNQQIVEKLEASTLSNKGELLAIHQGNMRNLNDVLDGYIKIKIEPHHYFQAQERLEKAKASLENGHQVLQETLRQINENDMMNFEISLRLLQNEH
ncbi:hypothetical protein ACVR1I_05595 [Streptococcus cameli]